MANTTRQFLWNKWNAIVTSNVVTGQAATLQTHKQTYGTFVLNGVTPVTVADANVSSVASVITISLNTVGGTVGAIPAIQTITSGTGFTVAGTALDTSIYNYKIEG